MKRKKSKEQPNSLGYASLESARAIEDLQWTKYASKNGHGFAAEDANALNEKLRGWKPEKVGRSNEKDGADRIVKGRMIQTKYYKSARETVNSAFSKETGIYRYKNQVIEVPKDQYDEALLRMAEKIKEGKVPGTTDPRDAHKLIKKGDVTYQQAKNIAKAGNVDSLIFDVKSQTVAASSTAGISFIIQFAVGKWNGMTNKEALRFSVVSSLKTGAVALGTGVLVQQLLRTSFGRGFASFATVISKKAVNAAYQTGLGKTVIHKIATRLLGKRITGAAAKNVITKAARSNIVTGTAIAVVTTVPDFFKAMVRKRISWKQFAKNSTVNVAGLAGGIAGGAALGSIVPVVGTVIGGIIGGIAGALGTKKALDRIVKDDAEEMFEIAQEAIADLAMDYMLSEEEFERIAESIQEKVQPKWLETMYQIGAHSDTDARSTRYAFAYRELEPVFEDIVKSRPKITAPGKLAITMQYLSMNTYLFFQYIKARLAKLFGFKSELSTLL